MTAKYSLYLGEAGQAAASSYFLARGWNVATPRVDIGDDLLVIEDMQGFFKRIQIKTAQTIERKEGFGVRFKLSMKQLQNRYNPELYYMFMVFRENDWHHKILVQRETLLDYHLNNGIGSLVEDNLVIYFSFHKGKVLCSKVDITEFYNNFEDFPIIPH
jgi:hypothetical protein